jgi:purine-binding chemotaxis protein CheW
VTGRFLVVRAGGERFGLALAAVREVVDVVPPRPVPASTPALRGLMPHRERFVSLLSLAALVRGTAPPGPLAETAVVLEAGGTTMAVEVDDVEEVVDQAATLVGPAQAPWASGVWRVGGELVTVLELDVLAERISEIGSRDDSG